MARLPKRPRDPSNGPNLVFDMAIGKVPNDKEQVLEARRQEAHPTGNAKSAKA